MGNPAQFGKYLLLERIGVGGMAEVFKAKTFGAEGFERLVAIKRILSHLVEDDDFVKMFIDEAKIAVRLQHPNIVGIHDLGRAGGTLYIAMELVPGRDLRAIYDAEQKRQRKTPVGLACHIVMKMCEALHHAHFATGPHGEPLQVIHRDVSPQNVLVSFDGEVKVADFGLAKARGRMIQTQAGVVKGKLAYMSPEQLRGDEIDHRVDVFGLGIVLFELLTGTRLFLGPTDMDTLRRVYEARIPPMRELNPEIHPELEQIARRALAKDRDERYVTALDLHDELQAFVYAHGCYANSSALRAYLRELFPEAAPPDELPPFSSPRASTVRPPSPPPKPTFRPPSRSTSEPNWPSPLGPPVADLPQEPSFLLHPIEESDLLAVDGPATERPPAPTGGFAEPIVPLDEPPLVDTALSSALTESYGDWPAIAPEPHETRHDTRPVPAPSDPFPVSEWEDDEPTIHTPLSAPLPAPAPTELDSLWDVDDDEQTIIVDPKPGKGS